MLIPPLAWYSSNPDVSKPNQFPSHLAIEVTKLSSIPRGLTVKRASRVFVKSPENILSNHSSVASALISPKDNPSTIPPAAEVIFSYIEVILSPSLSEASLQPFHPSYTAVIAARGRASFPNIRAALPAVLAIPAILLDAPPAAPEALPATPAAPERPNTLPILGNPLTKDESPERATLIVLKGASTATPKSAAPIIPTLEELPSLIPTSVRKDSIFSLTDCTKPNRSPTLPKNRKPNRPPSIL